MRIWGGRKGVAGRYDCPAIEGPGGDTGGKTIKCNELNGRIGERKRDLRKKGKGEGGGRDKIGSTKEK